MSRFIDLTNQRFGRLIVLRQNGRSKGNSVLWLCQCDCGKQRTVASPDLRSNHTRSCGCLNIDQLKSNPIGVRHGKYNSPEYLSWKSMLARCRNPNSPDYKRYGGRGITVCEQWHSFSKFLEDMGARPEGMTLDRYPDNDGNYELSNCRWATPMQQIISQQPNRTKRGRFAKKA
jgi:hypothetical protein